MFRFVFFLCLWMFNQCIPFPHCHKMSDRKTEMCWVLAHTQRKWKPFFSKTWNESFPSNWSFLVHLLHIPNGLINCIYFYQSQSRGLREFPQIYVLLWHSEETAIKWVFGRKKVGGTNAREAKTLSTTTVDTLTIEPHFSREIVRWESEVVANEMKLPQSSVSSTCVLLNGFLSF